jgi:hypothetical protein
VVPSRCLYFVSVVSKYLNYDHELGEQCYYPSIDGLDAIYESYPTLTMVNVIRNSTAWYESLQGWSHASLFVRFRLCNATGFPNGQSTRADFIRMYENHNAMIRQFVRDRPSITYLEVQLESSRTGQILSDATGIDPQCWKLCKPQERKCQENSIPQQQQQSSSSEASTNDDGGEEEAEADND